MSYWNHRVLKTTLPNGESYLEIVAVHYNNDGTIYAHTEEGVKIYGESIEELKQILQWCFNCLEFPILERGKIDFVDWEYREKYAENSNNPSRE